MNRGRPQISAILFTPSTFDVISRVVRHLHAQSVRDQIEVVIACPAASRLHPDLSLLEGFGGFVVVEVGDAAQFAARAAAIRAATAPIIGLRCQIITAAMPIPASEGRMSTSARFSSSAIARLVRSSQTWMAPEWFFECQAIG